MRTWQTPAAAALSHARRGWVLVPLWPGSNKAARKWGRLTCTPPGDVARHWPGPQYNPGVLTGPSGLVVIDLDDHDAHRTELPPDWVGTGVTHGAEVLAILAARAGEKVPRTYTVTTPRGGAHLYFRAPAGLVIRNSTGASGRGLGPGIDTRAWGGLIVGAGSVRPNGTYQLADDQDPVMLPGWLAELATRRPEPPVRPRITPVVSDGRLDGHGYGASALRGEVEILLAAGRGSRNDQLNKSAFVLGTLVGANVLDGDTVTVALLEAARAIGLIADDGQAAAERTIASGLRAGIARPRIWRAA